MAALHLGIMSEKKYVFKYWNHFSAWDMADSRLTTQVHSNMCSLDGMELGNNVCWGGGCCLDFINRMLFLLTLSLFSCFVCLSKFSYGQWVPDNISER